MSLQWVVCGALCVMESALLLFLSIPSYRAVRARVIPLVARAMQPLLAIVPFAVFQLLDVYWKYEHSPNCEAGMCPPSERDRHEKSAVKNQRNFLLAVAALFLYWLLHRFVKIHLAILRMEDEIKKLKDA